MPIINNIEIHRTSDGLTRLRPLPGKSVYYYKNYLEGLIAYATGHLNNADFEGTITKEIPNTTNNPLPL